MNYDRIKKLRESTGMSARKFAEAIDMKYTTYYGYENGVSEPNSAVIVKLCSYFGCTADYLLGLVDEPSSLYESKKKSPDPAAAETRELTREELIDILMRLRILRSPTDTLSDADLKFLMHVISVLDDWFSQRE